MPNSIPHGTHPFAELLNREPRRQTCYGLVTEAEYEARAAVDRAKAQARRDCTLCDADGYRNRYVCNHGEYAPERAREARKKSFRVIDGGGA